MENKWTLRVVFVLAVCFTRSLTSGKYDETMGEVTKLEASRNASAELGSTLTLLCTSSVIDWDKMIFVIWKINSQEKSCRIGVSSNDPDNNTCNDDKHISSGANYSLEIPNFSVKDEGNYTCDVSYVGGGIMETVTVSAWAPPQTSYRRVTKGLNTFAVCEARSIPAASIQWETSWISPSPSEISSQDPSNEYVTVTSWLQLPHNYTLKNLTCVVHHLGRQVAQYKFEVLPDTKPLEWPLILLGVCGTCSTVALLTGLYLTRGKLRQLRVFRKICCSSQVSQAPREEKAPQPHDPEEVEPYASYVQRVNSIYNSSAELFNA